MSFDYIVVRRREFFISFKTRIPRLFFSLWQEILNELDSVPDRGPVVTGKQSAEIWIVTEVRSCHLGNR